MFGSRPPQKDRRGRFWEWLNPALGKEVHGWLAGVIVGVETHFTGRTMPCRRFITGGRMRCYCTDSQLATTWKGYVPLWNADGVQCFAIIGERYYELAAQIQLFAPVTVTRLRSAGAPIRVSQSTWTDSPPPAHGHKLARKDLRPWLLKLWHDETLNEWLNAHGHEMPEAAPGDLDPEQFTPMLREPVRKANAALDRHRAAQRAVAGNDLPPTVGETLAAVPSVNGKRKH